VSRARAAPGGVTRGRAAPGVSPCRLGLFSSSDRQKRPIVAGNEFDGVDPPRFRLRTGPQRVRTPPGDLAGPPTHSPTSTRWQAGC
jgi:hypothetical protein